MRCRITRRPRVRETDAIPRSAMPVELATATVSDLPQAACRKPTGLRARDGSLDCRSPVGSRRTMNELLVGHARPSIEQQDLTAPRDRLHPLGVVSKAGPRVR